MGCAPALATNQVEQGAQKTAGGKISDGVAETARGIGQTVSEGAQYSAEKVKAKSAWGHARRVRAQRRAVLRESVYQMKGPSIVKDRAACATRMGTVSVRRLALLAAGLGLAFWVLAGAPTGATTQDNQLVVASRSNETQSPGTAGGIKL